MLRCKGFDSAVSNQLSGFSQYVDDNARTEPIYCWPSTRAKFHFVGSNSNTATKRNDSTAQADLTEAFGQWLSGDPAAKYRVGWKLHLFADTFSHEGFTAYWNNKINEREGSLRPRMGHADAPEDGHAPDRPYNDPTRAVEAATAIYRAIPSRGEVAGVCWDAIRPELEIIFDGKSNGGHRGLTERVAALQALIAKAFSEHPVYDRREFAKERKEFERAVGQ